MRSFTTLAAAAATLLPLVSAAPGAGTVQLDFHKRTVERTPGSLARRQTSKTVNTAISNEQILYLINVTVGTPPQSIGLQLDTGSSDIWYPAASARTCIAGDCIVGSYNQSASSSYRDPGLGTFSITYVDGTEVEGDYVSDVLTVGGTSVTNLTMASCTSLGDQQYGIMGIGFSADESSAQLQQPFTYPNIIDVLVSEGKINTRSYSLWLDDLSSNTGSILFGGVDTDKYTGSLTAIPIQKDADSGTYTSFTVALTGLTVVGGGQTSNLSPTSPVAAILDSGTTLLLLPDDMATSIFNGVGVITDRTYGDVVPCGLANDNLTFTFQFGGSNGPKIAVPISEFVLPLETTTGAQPKFRGGQYNGQTACQFGIEAAGTRPVLFGDTFLRSAYVVYDLDNLEIGLAQLNRNGNTNEGHVQAFSSGTLMPDATATVTGVTVSATTDANGPENQSTVRGTGDAGDGATSRTPTFSLVSATGTGSRSSATNAAASLAVPPMQKSTFIAAGLTVAAFLFGTMML